MDRENFKVVDSYSCADCGSNNEISLCQYSEEKEVQMLCEDSFETYPIKRTINHSIYLCGECIEKAL